VNLLSAHKNVVMSAVIVMSPVLPLILVLNICDTPPVCHRTADGATCSAAADPNAVVAGSQCLSAEAVAGTVTTCL